MNPFPLNAINHAVAIAFDKITLKPMIIGQGFMKRLKELA